MPRQPPAETAESWPARLRAAERGRFIPWLALAMAAGAALAATLRVEPAPWVGTAALALGTLLAGLARRRHWLRAAGLALAAGGLGFAALQFATAHAPPVVALPARATIVTGTVRAVEPLPRGLRVLIEAPALDGQPPLPRGLRIRLRADDPARPATGDHLRLRSLLRPAAPPAFPGAWDLQYEAYFNGLAGYGFALDRAELRPAAPSGPAAALQALRETIAARIAAALPAAPASIAITLLTGSTTAIPEADRAAFRDSGLAHLLAIAGLHIGLVMAFWFGLVRLALALSERATLYWPIKQIAALAGLAAGLAYLLLTGAHVPILRSFAMACLVTLGVMLGRRALSLRGLAFAMAVVVLLAPQEVIGVSFQMSFSAVLALIAGYDALGPWLVRLRGEGGLGRWLASHAVMLALTSALAGTASAPFASYHFGHIQLYYVLANLFAVPITAVLVMPAAMLALLLMPLHAEALALLPMGWGIQAVLWIARTVAALPAAVLAVPHIPGWGLLLTTLGLAWLGIWRTRWRLLGGPVLLLGLLSPLADRPPDILVSADARLIGLRTPQALQIAVHGGADRFVRDAWLAFLGLRAVTDISLCPGLCPLRPRPDGPAAVLVAQAAVPPCDGSLLISAEPIRTACAGATVIDRFTVWRDGAHAVWLDPAGPRVLSDREARGARPWVAPTPNRIRQAAGVTLTPAPAEPLPDE